MKLYYFLILASLSLQAGAGKRDRTCQKTIDTFKKPNIEYIKADGEDASYSFPPKISFAVVDGEGRNKLQRAVLSRDINKVRHIAEKIISKKGVGALVKMIDKRDKAGFNSLHLAILSEDVEITRYLVRSTDSARYFPNVNLLWERDRNDRTPLHLAAYVGTEEMYMAIRQGLSIDELGTLINKTDIAGQTVLHYVVNNYAVNKEALKVAELLLMANKHVVYEHYLLGKDKYGKTPFEYAIDKPGMRKLFVKYKVPGSGKSMEQRYSELEAELKAAKANL